LAVSREKKKEKRKKKTSLWCFVLDKAWGVRCSRIKHPPELVQVSTFFSFFFLGENAWLLQLYVSLIFHQNNSDDEK
jgi:hypothetical protein